MTICSLFLILTNVLAAHICFRKYFRRSDLTQTELEDILGTLILTLQSGRSFENAVQDLLSDHTQLSAQLESKGTHATEMVQILNQCRQKPAQSLKILSCYRNFQRLRSRFTQKASSASLQAKAQGVVSAVIYLVIFVFQFWVNDDFRVFFATSFGRGLIILSLILLGGGMFWVFRMSKLREFRL